MTLGVVVGQLDKLDEISPAIEQLAIRHIDYGVKEEHYELVGTTLLWALEKLLGEAWNEQLANAWATCYGILSQKMIRAAYTKTKQEQIII